MKNGANVFGDRRHFNPDSFEELWIMTPSKAVVIHGDKILLDDEPINILFDMDGLFLPFCSVDRSIRPEPYTAQTDLFSGAKYVGSTRPISGCDITQSVFHGGRRRVINVAVIASAKLSLSVTPHNCSAVITYRDYAQQVLSDNSLLIMEEELCLE